MQSDCTPALSHNAVHIDTVHKMFLHSRFAPHVPLGVPVALAALGTLPGAEWRKRHVHCGGEEFLEEMDLGSLLKAKQSSSPDALAHFGRLKAAHDASAKLFGDSGEKVAQLWGQSEAAFAQKHVATESLNPNALLLSAGHAALACFDGAHLLGNRANPNPPSTLLIGIGADSVGKSRQTSFALKLLTRLQHSVRPAVPQPSVEDRANAEAERVGGGELKRGKLSKDGFSAQSFSGKGFASRCMDGKLRSPVFIIDEALSMFTQLGLSSDPGKVNDAQLEDQAMMSTIWSTGTYRKDLADGGGYDLPWTCPSFHTNAHVEYMCRLLTGETGKDPTAFRRRLLVYALRPMFRHKVKQYLIQQGLATSETVEGVLRAWPDNTASIVQRLKAMHEHFAEAQCNERMIDLSPEARNMYETFLDKAGQAQEEFMYTRLYATSVLGKLPEVTLRASVLAWCAAYLSGAGDATLVRDGDVRKAVISARHFTMGKFLAAASLRVQASLLTPAAVPAAPRPSAVPPQLGLQSVAAASVSAGLMPAGDAGAGGPASDIVRTPTAGAMPILAGLLLRSDVAALTEALPGHANHVQDSFMPDREIIRRSIIAVSSSIKTQSTVPARVCNGWKKREMKDQPLEGKPKWLSMLFLSAVVNGPRAFLNVPPLSGCSERCFDLFLWTTDCRTLSISIQSH